MDNKLNIREFKLSDIRTLTEIQRLAFPETIENYFSDKSLPSKPEQLIFSNLFSALFQTMKDDTFTAELGGKIVGCVMAPYDITFTQKKMIVTREFWSGLSKGFLYFSFSPIEIRKKLIGDQNEIAKLDKKSHRKSIRSRIFSIAVHPDYQGQNIGKALMDRALENLFNERKSHAVTLNVRSKNTHAIELYQTLGFKEVDKMNNSLGEWLVMVLNKEDWKN